MFSRAQRGVIELQSFSGKSETVLKGGMRKGEGEGKDENSSQEFILKGRGRDGEILLCVRISNSKQGRGKLEKQRNKQLR